MKTVAAAAAAAAAGAQVEGRGWREGACDFVLGDIGWLTLTGSGPLKLSICLPETVRLFVAASLLPCLFSLLSCLSLSPKHLEECAGREAP